MTLKVQMHLFLFANIIKQLSLNPLKLLQVRCLCTDVSICCISQQGSVWTWFCQGGYVTLLTSTVFSAVSVSVVFWSKLVAALKAARGQSIPARSWLLAQRRAMNGASGSERALCYLLVLTTQRSVPPTCHSQFGYVFGSAFKPGEVTTLPEVCVILSLLGPSLQSPCGQIPQQVPLRWYSYRSSVPITENTCTGLPAQKQGISHKKLRATVCISTSLSKIYQNISCLAGCWRPWQCLAVISVLVLQQPSFLLLPSAVNLSDSWWPPIFGYQPLQNTYINVLDLGNHTVTARSSVAGIALLGVIWDRSPKNSELFGFWKTAAECDHDIKTGTGKFDMAV